MQQPNLEIALKNISYKENLISTDTIRGTQFQQPLCEFSGACAGCGETPYIKLVTQLFGPRMVVANATGCSSIYGASMPRMPYTKNCNGHGPAWGNSLFEDAAEYGYGICTALKQRREKLEKIIKEALALVNMNANMQHALAQWL